MAEFDEAAWWGDCGNTFHEEQKQQVYARFMGLNRVPDHMVGHPPIYSLGGKNVVDIGGGPVSLLLKCAQRGTACTVVDPTQYPAWVYERYAAAGIEHDNRRGEDYYNAEWVSWPFEEAWCYNVLQHVDDPERIAYNMKVAAPYRRVFEWIDLPAYDGHPQALTEPLLNRIFNTRGGVAEVNESGAVGTAWFCDE